MSSLNDAQLFDKSFVLTMINDLKRLLIYLPKGLYGNDFFGDHEYEAKASETKAMTLDIYYSGLLIYFQIFKEAYPEKNASKDQIERLNTIWQAIGHPENIIPV